MDFVAVKFIWIAVAISVVSPVSAHQRVRHGLAKPRRHAPPTERAPLTLDDVKELASKAGNPEFELIVNDEVLNQLNKYLGPAWYRRSLKASLARLDKIKTELASEVSLQRVPWEIMAIPLLESGFQSPSESRGRGRTAGLWQFTRGSGRARGLRVEHPHDDRLDLKKSTRAAVKYLKELHDTHFQSWPLAVLAYNIGSENVRKNLERSASKDAFEVIRNGKKIGDPDYLAKFMALVIILKNPELLAG